MCLLPSCMHFQYQFQVEGTNKSVTSHSEMVFIHEGTERLHLGQLWTAVLRGGDLLQDCEWDIQGSWHQGVF